MHVPDGTRTGSGWAASARQSGGQEGARRSVPRHHRHALGPRRLVHHRQPRCHGVDGDRYRRRRREAELPRLRPLRVSRRQGTQQGHLLETGGAPGPPLSAGLATPANPFRLTELHEEIDTWLRRNRPCTSSFPSLENSATKCCSATYGSILTSASVTGA